MKAKILSETAKIEWKALQRFYAQGRVIQVINDADLIELATAMANDNTELVTKWKAAGKFNAVSDEQALTWYSEDALVWAVTVAPFVLVQSIQLGTED